MGKWKVALCSGNSGLGEVDIKQGILSRRFFISFSVCFIVLTPLSLILKKAKSTYEFSGRKEKINHLLFMNDLKFYSRNKKELDSLVRTIRIFSKDIEIEFAIEKCTMLVTEKEKIVKSFGTELPDGKIIKSLQEGESCKYLGILEANRFLEEVKLKDSKEYFRRLKKVLK